MEPERRWVILTDDFPPCSGGVAVWTQAVAEELRARGECVQVFARQRGGLGLDPRGVPLSVPVRAVRGPSFARRGAWWMAATTWWRLRRGDRVLASTWTVAERVLARLRRLDLPLHVVAHGSDVTRPPRSEEGFQRVWTAASHRWAVSQFLADRLAVRGVEAQVLAAPVKFAGPCLGVVDRPCHHWGVVARATELKGGDRFLRLLAAEPGARGTVLGTGPALSQWVALADSLGIADRVDFIGEVERSVALDWMRRFDAVFLLPREHADGDGAEGLGLSLIEAAAQATAVVGCRTGGVPEAIGPGLVLSDPDDVMGSLTQLHGWWHGGRGAECQDWAREHHGTQRTVDQLLSASE